MIRKNGIQVLLLALCLSSSVSSVLLVRANNRLASELKSQSSLLQTPIGVKLPAVRGTDRQGRDSSVSFDGGSRKTLLLVFSPSCGYCKKTWTAWLDLIKNCQGSRSVFVNTGGPITDDFSRNFPFTGGDLMAQVSPQSKLDYRWRQTPITVVLSAEGRSEGVWSGAVGEGTLREIEGVAGCRVD